MRLIERLNGWQRLWIVMSMLYGLAVIAMTIALLPKERDITSSWSWDVLRTLSEDIKRTSGREVSPLELKDAESFRGKSDEQIAREMTDSAKTLDLNNPVKKDLAQYQKEMLSLERKYEAKLGAVTRKQIKFIAVAFVAWLVPSLLLLGFGYAVAWVYSGFKRS